MEELLIRVTIIVSVRRSSFQNATHLNNAMRRRAKVWLRSLCAHLCFCVSSLPPDTLTRMQTCWSVQNRISDINTHMNYWCTANPQPHIRPFIYYQPGSQRGCTAVSLGKISANCLCPISQSKTVCVSVWETKWGRKAREQGSVTRARIRSRCDAWSFSCTVKQDVCH